ncbi:MAG: ImmA/IrrE family metallo-endopeptidase [Anaerolineales bacterium]|nr:ImmA/IrrE family metallo-endopeptidase [Anaerolineales bacterium]
MNFPERTANSVIDKLSISSPDDLLQLKKIIYARGAIYREWPIQGAEARLMIGHGKPIITISSSPTINHHRRRFSTAHELGHLELHRGMGLLVSCTNQDIQYKPDNTDIDIEQEANQFAAAFLIPARFVEKPFTENEPSFDIIADWASTLETSLTATALRFVRFTPKPVAVVYSSQNIIRYFQPSKEFMELGVFPDVKNLVGTHTDAKKLFQGISIKNQWREVRATEWFREDSTAFDEADVIREWSISMPSYQAVLSLLWVHEPLGEDLDW